MGVNVGIGCEALGAEGGGAGEGGGDGPDLGLEKLERICRKRKTCPPTL